MYAHLRCSRMLCMIGIGRAEVSVYDAAQLPNGSCKHAE